jgi:hypothetical protein
MATNACHNGQLSHGFRAFGTGRIVDCAKFTVAVRKYQK